MISLVPEGAIEMVTVAWLAVAALLTLLLLAAARYVFEGIDRFSPKHHA
jgi:hypothetical protein